MSNSNLTVLRAEVISVDDIILLIENTPYDAQFEVDEIFEDDAEILDAEDTLLLALYRENLRTDADIDSVREAYLGEYKKPSDWAWQFLEDSGVIGETPECLHSYLDLDAWASDARISGDVVFVEKSGLTYVFSGH